MPPIFVRPMSVRQAMALTPRDHAACLPLHNNRAAAFLQLQQFRDVVQVQPPSTLHPLLQPPNPRAGVSYRKCDPKRNPAPYTRTPGSPSPPPPSVQECNIVLAAEPTHAQALLRRAKAYEGTGQYAKALRDVEAIEAAASSSGAAAARGGSSEEVAALKAALTDKMAGPLGRLRPTLPPKHSN